LAEREGIGRRKNYGHDVRRDDEVERARETEKHLICTTRGTAVRV